MLDAETCLVHLGTRGLLHGCALPGRVRWSQAGIVWGCWGPVGQHATRLLQKCEGQVHERLLSEEQGPAMLAGWRLQCQWGGVVRALCGPSEACE